MIRPSDMLNRDQVNKILFASIGIGMLYLILSVCWILFSDHIAASLASSREDLEIIQKYKGLGFVIVMTVLITWLVYRIQQHGLLLKRTLHNIHTDVVTGLPNRRVAEQFLDKRLKETEGRNQNCGIILINISGLSRINRSVGRSGGDYLLFKVGQRIQEVTQSNDLVARFESNRIVIVLSGAVDDTDAINLGNKVLKNFVLPVRINNVEVQVNLQCVLAMSPADGRTTFELFDVSERALYRLKEDNMKSCLVLVNKEDQQNNSENLELEAELRKAIREQKLTIALQPQVRLDTFEVMGAEALVRWHSPKFGNVTPAEFIPLAESLGLIQEITRQVLDAVGACIALWLKRDLPQVPVSVNLSGLDLKNDRILETVQSFLDHHRIPGNLINLEITETWLMGDPNIALGLIYRLRELGPRFAIDDFGTGYSALSQLIEFPFDCVKFDRSFISGINHSPKKVKVLIAMQRMSSTLAAQTIAEGVETMDELALLEQIGIYGAQGYLFAKPVTLEEFETRYLDPDQPPFAGIQAELEKLRARNPHRAIPIGKAV